MATLNEWFKEKDYNTGLALLSQRSKNKVLIMNISRKPNPAKLEHVTGPEEKAPAAPELLGLAAFCHALLSSNEFLYVD